MSNFLDVSVTNNCKEFDHTRSYSSRREILNQKYVHRPEKRNYIGLGQKRNILNLKFIKNQII